MSLLVVNSLALLPAPRSPQPPHHDHLSRRVLLGGATFAALSALPVASWADMPVLPEYDAEGKPLNLQGYLEDVAFRTVKVGPTTANLLRDWTWEGPAGGLIDPVQGDTATMMQLSSTDSAFAKVEDLGKPENVQLVKALGLEPELIRADMVAAAKRKSQGTTFYDYDLALSPKTCNQEMATACLPTKVILLSAGISGGQLHIMRIDADAVQWKRAGVALRLLRSSFAVPAAGEPS